MNKLKDLPHKPVFLGGAIALLILSTWAYQNISFRTWFAPSKSYVASRESSKPVLFTPGEAILSDGDKDGLPDWEEGLYGSDLSNPDSDGDGTQDGAELSLGRNPVVANTAPSGAKPNDPIPGFEEGVLSHIATSTAALRKEFFEKYLIAQGDQIRRATYDDLLKEFDATKYKPSTDQSTITLGDDNSPEALRAYGNAFGLIIRKYATTPYRNEEAIIEAALPSKDSTILQELAIPAAGYSDFAKDLRAMSVPSSLKTSHLLVVNGYDGMATGLRDMQYLFSNPIKGAGGYEGYTVKRLDVINGYAGIVSAFREKGVIFASDEPGVLFSGASATSTTR